MTDNSIEPREDKALIRVLVADNTRVNSQMLSDVLARNKRFRVLETQLSAAAILATAEREKPDVVLIGLLLENDPNLGFDVTRQLRASHPASRIVMLLDRSERGSAVEAFRAGATGIFCRNESAKMLANAFLAFMPARCGRTAAKRNICSMLFLKRCRRAAPPCS